MQQQIVQEYLAIPELPIEQSLKIVKVETMCWDSYERCSFPLIKYVKPTKKLTNVRYGWFQEVDPETFRDDYLLHFFPHLLKPSDHYVSPVVVTDEFNRRFRASPSTWIPWCSVRDVLLRRGGRFKLGIRLQDGEENDPLPQFSKCLVVVLTRSVMHLFYKLGFKNIRKLSPVTSR